MNTRLLGLQLGFIKNSNKILGMIAGGKLPTEALSRYLSSTGMLPKVETYAANKGLSLVDAARNFFSKSKATRQGLNVTRNFEGPVLSYTNTPAGKVYSRNDDLNNALSAKTFIKRRQNLKTSPDLGFDPTHPFNPETIWSNVVRVKLPSNIQTFKVRNVKALEKGLAEKPKYSWNTKGSFGGDYSSDTGRVRIPNVGETQKVLSRTNLTPTQIANEVDAALGVGRHEIGHLQTYQNPQLADLYSRAILPFFKKFNWTKLPAEKRQEFLSEFLAQMRGSYGTSRGATSLRNESKVPLVEAKQYSFFKDQPQALQYAREKIDALPQNLKERMHSSFNHAMNSYYY